MEKSLAHFSLTVAEDTSAVKWDLTDNAGNRVTYVIEANSFLEIAKAQFDAARAIVQKRRQ